MFTPSCHALKASILIGGSSSCSKKQKKNNCKNIKLEKPNVEKGKLEHISFLFFRKVARSTILYERKIKYISFSFS